MRIIFSLSTVPEKETNICEKFISINILSDCNIYDISYNMYVLFYYLIAYFVVCQVFSVGVLLSVGVCCMIMSMIFLRATGQQKWTYWILSTILCLLMTISSK